MLTDPAVDSRPHSTRSHVLLVVDWTVDPHAVVAEARRHRRERSATVFGVLVPAWLHGLDWVGDPRASVPCAQRQVSAIRDLAAGAGLHVDVAMVGDPDPATAIGDAALDWAADEILLFARASRLPFSPFDLVHRAQRLTGLPVRRIGVPVTAAPARSGWTGGHRDHCVPDAAAVA